MSLGGEASKADSEAEIFLSNICDKDDIEFHTPPTNDGEGL
jgi:hypothetical protein